MYDNPYHPSIVTLLGFCKIIFIDFLEVTVYN
jgi:hypothetical protein